MIMKLVNQYILVFFSTTALYFQSISGQNIFPGDITGDPDVE